MKRVIASLIFLGMLSLASAANAAAVKSGPAGNPVELLTGEVWQQSKPDNKKAWLFGVDTAVSVEKAVADKLQQQKGKNRSAYKESPFVQKWIQAFGNSTREEIIDQVDQWYAANPDKLNRPVMDVIWYEIVVPRTGK